MAALLQFLLTLCLAINRTNGNQPPNVSPVWYTPGDGSGYNLNVTLSTTNPGGTPTVDDANHYTMQIAICSALNTLQVNDTAQVVCSFTSGQSTVYTTVDIRRVM